MNIVIRAILHEKDFRAGGIQYELIQREFKYDLTDSLELFALLRDRAIDIPGQCLLRLAQELMCDGCLVLETTGDILDASPEYFERMAEAGWQAVITREELEEISANPRRAYAIVGVPDIKPKPLRTIPRPPSAADTMQKLRGTPTSRAAAG